MVNRKKALMKLWKDKLSVTEYQKVKREDKSTDFEEKIVLDNQPCKLSFSTLQVTAQNDVNAQIFQVVKLFCDNEIEIKPGSKIAVQRNGQIFEYKQSGQPGIFTHHQEIVLIPWEGLA